MIIRGGEAVRGFAVAEAMLRLDGADLRDQPGVAPEVSAYLRSIRAEDPARFVELADRLHLPDAADALRAVVVGPDRTAAVAAARWLNEHEPDRLSAIRDDVTDDELAGFASVLAAVDQASTSKIAAEVMGDDRLNRQGRAGVARALGGNWHGQRRLLTLATAGSIPEDVRFIVRDALIGSWSEEVRKEASQIRWLTDAGTDEPDADPKPPISVMRSMANDPTRGREVYFGIGTCAKCHQMNGEGQNVGPDLSEIGSKLSTDDLFVAILQPSAGISHNYETYNVLTYDGAVVSGLKVGETEEQVTIKSADGTTHVVAVDDIEDIRRSETSLMPAGLERPMTTQQLVDLVEFLRMQKSEAESRFLVTAAGDDHDPAAAVDTLTVADGLTVQLFASEPMMHSPSAIDVDSRGRVYVAEIVNYRHFRNDENVERPEGDRILILTDTDGDGAADDSTVFYQGTDINSPHGVTVLDDRVLVSAGANVWELRDTDGDDVADQKRALFTGIGGVDHDHGIHSFMPGPDGKLYFNFGNEGKQILDADGKPIVDRAGNVVADHRRPYQQGMVFRCDPDGSNLETLGWNFRNNWEVAVDSFGAMWQSDNDDDGNRGTRINFVMEYGDYGYRDRKTGDYWQSDRVTIEPDTSTRHWHLSDPGTVPNLLQTGAGSPTGMMIYEGDLLPPRFRGMVHTDPGPNVVRGYPTEIDGAGYTADIAELIRGTGDAWFRPVDAVAAPDGSIIVADWYDPGVGGHRMGDQTRGRIFRITTDDATAYRSPAIDLSTEAGALEALQSPNVATRYRALRSLRERWTGETPDIARLLAVDDPIRRVRRAWALTGVPAVADRAVEAMLADDDLNVRLAGIRAARRCEGYDVVAMIDRMADDPSAQIRRELLIALRESDSSRVPELWTRLASHHDGSDRWYLEALGIAADGRWSECFAAWRDAVGDDWDTPAGRDIVWRAECDAACRLLPDLIADADDIDDQRRYFRALDFHDGEAKEDALREIIRGEAS